MLAPWKKSYDQPRQHIKKQRYYFANKGPSSEDYGFSSSHIWMWEMDYKENWMLKNWCFWTVVLEKTLESPLDWKEIQSFNLKGNQSWMFIGRTDAKAETPILGNLMRWTDSLEKTLMMGKIEGRKRRWRQRMRWLDGITDSMDSRECGWTLGVGDGQGSLLCCSLWGRKELDTTEWLNWTDTIFICSRQWLIWEKVLNT